MSFYWYKLIDYWVNNRKRNGLTIPFIIGARTILDQTYSIDDKSIQNLFNEIIESEEQNVITLQRCENVRDYVLGFNDPLSPKVGNQFHNTKNNKLRLIATIDTETLGTELNQIINSLNDRYSGCLKLKKFSRSFDGWTDFSDFDKELINSALKKDSA